jgi:hypothetical protein
VKSLIKIDSVTFLFLLSQAAQAATIIDFEGSTAGCFTSVASQGYLFESSDGQVLSIETVNGSQFLTTGSPLGAETLTMTRMGGGTFDLMSLDLCHTLTLVPSRFMRLTGYFPDGSTVTQNLPLDSIMPITTFKTFFPGGFTGVERVIFGAEFAVPFSMDNVVVPEPATFLLAAVACLLAGRRTGTRWPAKR